MVYQINATPITQLSPSFVLSQTLSTIFTHGHRTEMSISTLPLSTPSRFASGGPHAETKPCRLSSCSRVYRRVLTFNHGRSALPVQIVSVLLNCSLFFHLFLTATLDLLCHSPMFEHPRNTAFCSFPTPHRKRRLFIIS